MARILVIDDEEMVRDTIRRALEKDGHSVGEAVDGEQGVRLFEEKEPDLVITDILMPNKEGIETIQEIRKLQPDALIIAISGGGQMNDMSFLLPAKIFGAISVLEKPFSLGDLKQAVDDALASRSPV